MPRKRRTTKKRSDADMVKILGNPFSALNEPWNEPDFDWSTARRVWRQIRADTIAHWNRHYPGRQPPGVLLFDRNP